MKQFFLRPINNIFLILALISTISVSYLAYYIKFTDEVISDQEYLAKVELDINTFISSSTTKRLKIETFKGQSKSLLKKVNLIQKKIRTIPSSTFKSNCLIFL